jgi:glycosyltransferase involved in cell wall biosynthesis
VDEVLCPATAHPAAMAVHRELSRFRLLWKALREADIVHFNFGETIMPQGAHGVAWPGSPFGKGLHRLYGLYARVLEMRDVAWLKRAGKGIVVTFQGDDARQGDYCRDHFRIHPLDEVEEGYYHPAVDAHKRKRIAQFAALADRIYSVNPDLLHVLPEQAAFVPYASVDPREWPMVPWSLREDDVPVVVHAPSHRRVKGTRFLLEAVARLRAENVPLEFVLVENMTHAEARRLYERAHLLVDQVLLGWYGAVAVECMALGKPVICYIREEDLAFLPAGMRADLPILSAGPDTIYETLKTWLTARRGDLAEVGRRGRAYVETWHDPRKIAARLKTDYEAIRATRP